LLGKKANLRQQVRQAWLEKAGKQLDDADYVQAAANVRGLLDHFRDDAEAPTLLMQKIRTAWGAAAWQELKIDPAKALETSKAIEKACGGNAELEKLRKECLAQLRLKAEEKLQESKRLVKDEGQARKLLAEVEAMLNLHPELDPASKLREGVEEVRRSLGQS